MAYATGIMSGATGMFWISRHPLPLMSQLFIQTCIQTCIKI